MAIYISRNGERYGPYSLAEVQEQVRSGSVAMSDLAWQEGLPNWIPLNQIHGFTFVRPAVPVAPVATTTLEEVHRSPAEKKSLLQKIGTGIVAIGVILFKFAAPILVLLKTGGTMLLSIGAYSPVSYTHLIILVLLALCIASIFAITTATYGNEALKRCV